MKKEFLENKSSITGLLGFIVTWGFLLITFLAVNGLEMASENVLSEGGSLPIVMLGGFILIPIYFVGLIFSLISIILFIIDKVRNIPSSKSGLALGMLGLSSVLVLPIII